MLLAPLVLLGSLVACSSGGDPRAAPSRADVERFVAKYSSAMTGHDQGAVARLLDDSQAAAEFRTAQLSQYANLAQLPVQSWRLQVQSPVRPSGLGDLRKRYGAPVTVMHLQLTYQLRGIDTGPSTHDLWWTFVTRHGATRAASSTDVGSDGGISWRGPWEFGPIVAATGPGALVIGPPAYSAQVHALQAQVSAAAGTVSSVWGTDWARAATVVIPSSTEESQALGDTAAGASTAVSDEAAETIVSPTDPVTGKTPGALVIIAPDQFYRLTATGQQQVVTHELTHVASAADAGQTPRWLVEGLAEYVSHVGDTQPVPPQASELAAQVRAGTLPTQLPSDADFGSAPALSYEQAWLACAYVAERVGNAGLVRLYKQVGVLGQTSADTDANVSAALQTVLGQSVPAFLTGWQNYLRSVFG